MVSCMLELRQRMKMPDGYIASKKKKKKKRVRKWWRKTRRFVDEADMITRSRIKGMLHQFSSNFMAIFRSLAKSCHGGRKRLEGSSHLRIYQPLLSTRELAKQGKNSYWFLNFKRNSKRSWKLNEIEFIEDFLQNCLYIGRNVLMNKKQWNV